MKTTRSPSSGGATLRERADDAGPGNGISACEGVGAGSAFLALADACLPCPLPFLPGAFLGGGVSALAVGALVASAAGLEAGADAAQEADERSEQTRKARRGRITRRI